MAGVNVAGGSALSPAALVAGLATPTGAAASRAQALAALGADTPYTHGAVGNGTTDDTAAIDAWITAGLDKSSKYYAAVNGASVDYAGRPLILRTAAGRFLYNGTGHTYASSTDVNMLILVGDDSAACEFAVSSSVYMFQFAAPIKATVRGIRQFGGKGFLKFTGTGANVSNWIDVDKCEFIDFTEAALCSLSSNNPYWMVTQCRFAQTSMANTAVGLALAGLQDHSIISRSEWFKVKYGVKLGLGGNNAHIVHNSFIGATAGGADIWIVPRPTGSAQVNTGQGLTIADNRMGSEGAVSGKFRILVADEASGTDFGVKQHATTLSSGEFTGGRVSDNHFLGSAAWDKGQIYSYTPNVAGFYYGRNEKSTSEAFTIVEFDGVVTVLPGTGGYKGNMIDLTRAPDFHGALLGPIVPSNIAGFAQVIDPWGVTQGRSDGYSRQLSGVAPDDYLKLDLLSGATMNIVSGTRTALGAGTGPRGENAATAVLASASDICYGTDIKAVSGIAAGRTSWVVCALRKSASLPLDAVNLWVRRSSGSQFKELFVPLPLSAGWKTYVFPFHLAKTDGIEQILAMFTGNGWVTASKTSFDIAYLHVFHGSCPCDLPTTFGTAAPGTTPVRLDLRYIDTTNSKVYVSKGVASSSDWAVLN